MKISTVFLATIFLSVGTRVHFLSMKGNSMNKTYPKNRQHQILGLLQKHGTLTAGAIQTMIDPPINKRRLFDSISRLTKRGFIQKRWGWYYQIHQRDHGIKKVARFLKCSPESLKQPVFRRREPLHIERCAQWAHWLKQQFPESIIIRDYEYAESQMAQNVLKSVSHHPGEVPDLLMVIPKTENTDQTAIVFEIETYASSRDKLRRKLLHLLGTSDVDGVVCAFADDHKAEDLQRYWLKKLRRKTKAQHYADHFLLYQYDMTAPSTRDQVMLTLHDCAVSLMKWIHILRLIPMSERNKEVFDLAGYRC